MIDCVAEHCRDIKDAERKKGFSFFARDKTEEEKKALREEWYSTDLPVWLKKVGGCSKGNIQSGGICSGRGIELCGCCNFLFVEGLCSFGFGGCSKGNIQSGGICSGRGIELC